MDINQLVKFFISTSTIVALIIYLAKLIIDKIAEAKIEKYKNDLSIESVNYKHSLDKISTEHQIQYSKLYEERGQVIKNIYLLLYNLEKTLEALTTVFQGGDWMNVSEKDEKAKESIFRLREQLEVNRIFFSENLCLKIESILTDSLKIASEMYIVKKKEQRIDSHIRRGIEVSTQDLLEPTDKWNELDLRVQTNIKSARLDLAQEFRSLIGVE